MALVAVLSITDTTQLWHLAAVSFVTGAGMAFYYPAYSAWLPALVPAVRPAWRSTASRAWSGRRSVRRSARAWPGAVVGVASPGAAVAVAAAASALAPVSR